MDKITIERETLERLVRWIGGSRAIIETDLFNDLRAALVAQPVEPVAWLHIQGNHTEPSLWRLDADEITHGWTEVPLYAAPPVPAAVPLTKEQRELFDLILHHYGPDKRLQPLRDLIAAAGDKP